MKKLKYFFDGLIIGLLLLALFNGCQENQTPISPDNQTILTLDKWTLPAGASLTSATFHIHLGTANNQTVNIHRITSDWDEMVVTWANFGSAFDGTVRGSFAVGTTNEVWLTADITSLAQDWLAGTYPNYGLLLDQDVVDYPRADYYSRENVANYPPYLTLVYTKGGVSQTVELITIADTHIYETFFDLNLGAYPSLATGWDFPNDKEMQTLIKFDLGQAECETAYAYDDAPDGTCFRDLGFSNWGWSIQLPEPGTYTFDVYADAGECDITEGTMVGTVTANYSGGTVSFSYNFISGFSTNETHFYAGYDPVAKDKKGRPTVSPGQYKIGKHLSGPIYIIAHAVVCGDYTN